MHLAPSARGVTHGLRGLRALHGLRHMRTAAVVAKDGKAPGSSRGAQDVPGPLNDPFPLPFSPALDPARNVDMASKSQRVEGIEVPARVAGRTNEDRPTKLARLQYQCRKRGTLETDLILSTWAREELASLSDAELDELDRLLDEPDWDIFYWCTERKPVPEKWAESFATPGRLGHRIREHTRNDKRVPRRFPTLDTDIQSPA
ncbi:Succinate dehydrogenase assembly factor 2 mitochondrial [Malassezia cuniculi]|uniref:Succinate dehydrogenase assembly factor 2, mitochondrial n=1 Tax=Malassezia cuniculi TaxID=948313 RepID=A0AAF0ETP8_9BASI|nr:Succinate dehydrogenase assembly factor 2 mitochondrial [Malassezia cuniculi]